MLKKTKVKTEMMKDDEIKNEVHRQTHQVIIEIGGEVLKVHHQRQAVDTGKL